MGTVNESRMACIADELKGARDAINSLGLGIPTDFHCLNQAVDILITIVRFQTYFSESDRILKETINSLYLPVPKTLYQVVMEKGIKTGKRPPLAIDCEYCGSNQ